MSITEDSFLFGPAPAEILVSPGDTIAHVRRTVLFSCIAYGIPLPTFTWRRNDTILRNDSSTIIYQSLTTKRGVTFVKSTLEICSLRVDEDSGVYSCSAVNVATTASASFELEVKGIAIILQSLLWVEHYKCCFGSPQYQLK